MIIDCFTFYNELTLLEYRLTVLDKVDKFVLVEATKTHSGKPKELFYEQNKARFQKWADKIVHIIVDDFPESNDAWVPERFQRNAIQRGLNTLALNDEDTIIISDLDEIPNPAILSHKYSGIYALRQDAYYYNLTCFTTPNWTHAKIMNWGTYKLIGSPQTCRMSRVNGIVELGGWHLSYFGNTEFIRNKLLSFAHTEYSGEEFTNSKNIEDSIMNCKDLNCGRPFTKVSIEHNKNLPPNHEFLLVNFSI
jgi:beta-1,4-mannosyl-glycoprotein beta-1,4-N-acetylglucosaminyltransferase